MGPRAPLPLRGPQWRDQHPPRQRQLDARPRVAVRLAALRRGHGAAQADRPPGRQRLGHVRQLLRIPRPFRPSARPRRRHDDPRAVGQTRHHAAGPQRFLRIPFLSHGAVGWSRRGRLHRRHADWRRPRPQWPPSLPLLRDQRRPRRHGFRGRRPRHRAGARRAQRPPPARSHLSRRYKGGAHHFGRRNQSLPGQRASLWRMAERQLGQTGRSAGRCRAGAPGPRDRDHAAIRFRLHAGRPQSDHCPDGADRRRADWFDGQRLAAGRPLRQTQAALQLFQAALRAGHQSSDRFDPRGNRHLDAHHTRLGRQSPRAHAAELPPDPAGLAGHHERGTGKAPRPRPPRFQVRHPADPL